MMKKQMIKLLSLLLVIVTVVGVFASCGNGTPAETTQAGLNNETIPSDTTESVGGVDTTEQSVDTTEQVPTETTEDVGYVAEPDFETPETLTIQVEDGNVNYKVIRPQKSGATTPEVNRAQYIVSAFKDLIGASPALDTDWKRKNDADALEIVVGLTDYDETVAVLDNIGYGEYIVKAVGNKIVVMGYTPKAIEKATSELMAKLRANKSGKTVTISAEDLYCKGSVNSALDELPILVGNGENAIYYDAGLREIGSNCEAIFIQKTNEEGYNTYLKKLEAAGFTCYVSTDMGKNKFSTYTKGSTVVTLGYFISDKTIRITVEKNAPMTGLESENKFTKITSSQLSLLGQDVSGNELGLSELIRLEDGRFVVVDGGHKGANFASAFVAEIKKQAKGYTDKPVIAAWILTHAHSDHDALFYEYADDMKAQGITVEKVIFNYLASQEELNKLYALGVDAGRISYASSIEKCMKTAKNIGAKIYKAHTGQVFHIANVKIEILYTHETLYPGVVHTMNTTSLITKMTFTDSATGKVTTFLSTGDATSNSFKCLNANFKDYIDCDILTMAHHGGVVSATGAYAEKATNAIDAYKNASPTLALWPFGSNVSRAYYSQKDVDDALFALESLKEVYIAGNLGDATVVPLPYVVGNVDGKHEWDIVNKKLK